MNNSFVFLIFTNIIFILNANLSFAYDPISEAMCRDADSFRRCFGFTKEQCLEFADKSVGECLSMMPRRPPPPRSIEEIGESELGEWNLRLGYCSEYNFEQTNKEKYISDPLCADLSQRSQSLRERMGELKSKSSARQRVSIMKMISTPLFFATLFLAALFYWRSKRGKPNIVYGFLGWVIFVVGAFTGEIISHAIFSEIYIGIGDNPVQVAGFTVVFMVSFIIVPVIWFIFRYLAKSFK